MPTDTEAPTQAYRDLPHSPVRRMIAQRLTEAKQTIPHFYLTVRPRVDALLAMRKRLNSEEPDKRVSVNDLVIRAVALALREVPETNVSFHETAIRYHDAVDVAVAVATPRGLITPILREADTKHPRELARELAEMAERARTGRLRPHEYMGGTASVSNLGMFGVEEFTAIVNPPHACIFAIGAGMAQPIVFGGRIVPATLMATTISFDHRSIDGDVGAKLASVYKRLIESPEALIA